MNASRRVLLAALVLAGAAGGGCSLFHKSDSDSDSTPPACDPTDPTCTDGGSSPTGASSNTTTGTGTPNDVSPTSADASAGDGATSNDGAAATTADAGSNSADAGDAGDAADANDDGASNGDDSKCVNANDCVGCCQKHHPAGVGKWIDDFVACECGNGAKCADACAKSACNGGDPPDDSQCAHCLDQEIDNGGDCAQQAGDTCNADPDCAAESACEGTCSP